MSSPLPYLYPMPVKQIIPYSSRIFFITFTCHQWLPLTDKTNGYDIAYHWFEKSKGAIAGKQSQTNKNKYVNNKRYGTNRYEKSK
jgi:hypothetical protein